MGFPLATQYMIASCSNGHIVLGYCLTLAVVIGIVAWRWRHETDGSWVLSVHILVLQVTLFIVFASTVILLLPLHGRYDNPFTP